MANEPKPTEEPTSPEISPSLVPSSDASFSTLSFLTWNLAMLDRPATAPMDWSQAHTEEAVRQNVMELDPDVVCFQELPGLVPFIETHAMVPANPTTHNGNLATLIKHHLVERKPTARVIGNCALLLTFDKPALTIANVHLAPGKGAADERISQIAQIVQASPTERLLIVGDTNTRLAEAEDLRSLGLGGDKPPAPTWDSRRNRFHQKIPEFSAYFTRWFTGGKVTVMNAKVWNDSPTEHDDHSFFLSDHYALSGEVKTEK